MVVCHGAGTFHTPECMDPENTSHCWSHGDEAIPRNVYRICFECGHVWTKRSLVRAYRREIRSLRFPDEPFTSIVRHRWWRPLTVRASTIGFCQECLHDW